MPTITRSTSTPVGYLVSDLQLQLSELVAKMTANQSITAADVSALGALYNTFVAHQHTVSDLRGVDTFGNLGVYGTGIYVTSTTTSPSTILASTISQFYVGVAAEDLYFSEDGVYMYTITVGTGSDIYMYTLSIPWDINTASAVTSFHSSRNARSVVISPDGVNMYIVYDSWLGDGIQQYAMSTPWNVSTATVNGGAAIMQGVAQGLYISPTGTKVYVTGRQGDKVAEYDLTTPWDITTRTLVASTSIVNQEQSARGVTFKPDGTMMYIVGDIADTIFAYSLSTPWSVTSATVLPAALPVAAHDPTPTGVRFSSDGTRVFISGATNMAVHSITLGVPWDLTTTGTTPVTTGVVPANIDIDNEIQASDINAIVNLINTLRIHSHTIDDITS